MKISAEAECVTIVCSKAAVEPKNKDGKTALEVAKLNEQKDIVDLLSKNTKSAGDAKA